MSNPPTPPADDPRANLSREELMSAMFANMIVQQTNMAMMLLGRVAHPETGEFIQDVESARMFIDQLEMLEAKTRGNLSKQEEALLKQALASAHMAFVEAVNGPGPESRLDAKSAAPAIETPHAETPPKTPTPPAAETAAPPDDSRKKFSKKY
jgi:hypothetical protein